MKRRAAIMVCCLAIAFYVAFVYNDTALVSDGYLSQYFITNFISDTYANNAVAAIYLNYRVFDSIFETLILLVSVAAVINFSWRRDNEG